MTFPINCAFKSSIENYDQIQTSTRIIEQPELEDNSKDIGEISIFLQRHGITLKDLESEVDTIITIGSRFLLNYANSTSKEHQKVFDKTFIEKLNFVDLNNNSKKIPNLFNVNIIDLLKLINFKENRSITQTQKAIATRYIENIKDIMHKPSIQEGKTKKISIFLKIR